MILYVVIESKPTKHLKSGLNEEVVTRTISLHESKDNAVKTAISIARETSFDENKTIHFNDGDTYLTDGGWTIAIVKVFCQKSCS